jgi:hypothetical protein
MLIGMAICTCKCACTMWNAPTRARTCMRMRIYAYVRRGQDVHIRAGSCGAMLVSRAYPRACTRMHAHASENGCIRMHVRLNGHSDARMMQG